MIATVGKHRPYLALDQSGWYCHCPSKGVAIVKFRKHAFDDGAKIELPPEMWRAICQGCHQSMPYPKLESLTALGGRQ